ncbi:hypothetical protein ACFY0F_29160 [Streptomyces sp. NPDC001544]|uniref:hypothetical protein n=1 Tax=Streptomyces sp. NPDC001544 TaxID=3364584 RepID=UPI00367C59A8
MGGLVAALIVVYVSIIIGLAASKGNAMILWWLVLPLVPFLLVAALFTLIFGGLFGGAATSAVKQETGWGADGSRAYPYHVRIKE